MAILNVNPTRMELTNLKGKLSTATRGHKLLKDKRDELMREFIDLVRENKEVRREVEAGIAKANQHMAIARSVMSDESLNVALMLPMQEMSLDISEKNVMSVNIPVFDIQYKTADENDIYSYGYAFTSSDLDDAVKALSDIMPKMMRLAEIEKSCKILSADGRRDRKDQTPRQRARTRSDPELSGYHPVHPHEARRERKSQHDPTDEGQRHDARRSSSLLGTGTITNNSG